VIGKLATFAAGLWLGSRMTASHAGDPQWWGPAMMRLFAGDNVPMQVPDALLVRAEAAARAANVPIGFVLQAAKEGAADLVAAALDMRAQAIDLGAPSPDNAAQWRAKVIAAWR
jgi:hypothetical protein